MDWEMTLRNERYKGFEEGRQAGALAERVSMLIYQFRQGRDLKEAAEILGHDPEELRPIWDAVAAAAPEYSVEEILKMIGR